MKAVASFTNEPLTVAPRLPLDAYPSHITHCQCLRRMRVRGVKRLKKKTYKLNCLIFVIERWFSEVRVEGKRSLAIVIEP